MDLATFSLPRQEGSNDYQEAQVVYVLPWQQEITTGQEPGEQVRADEQQGVKRT
jgi:hypothetical protein